MKDTRKKILRTATQLFAKKGFSGTSVRDIVTQAHVNVSAINYYFGNKRALYKETLAHLVSEHRRKIWGPNMPRITIAELEKCSATQALALLQRMVDCLLEYGLNRRNLPLERIFTQVELESAPVRKMLLSYMAPFQELPYKLLAKITGLPEKSPQLVMVAHSIFGQIMLSESHRLVILNKLGVKHLSKEMCNQIKAVIWQHTLTILNSYKGIKLT